MFFLPPWSSLYSEYFRNSWAPVTLTSSIHDYDMISEETDGLVGVVGCLLCS
jgi:hypothetical protein